jgi:hypothetical protein
MAESDASARQRISFADNDRQKFAAVTCFSLYLALTGELKLTPQVFIAELGLFVSQCGNFGIPAVDEELKDLGEAISLMFHKVAALSGEPPEVDV